jgi:chromosome segregation ATPase
MSCTSCGSSKDPLNKKVRTLTRKLAKAEEKLDQATKDFAAEWFQLSSVITTKTAEIDSLIKKLVVVYGQASRYWHERNLFEARAGEQMIKHRDAAAEADRLRAELKQTEEERSFASGSYEMASTTLKVSREETRKAQAEADRLRSENETLKRERDGFLKRIKVNDES